jgi:hypothetical protein
MLASRKVLASSAAPWMPAKSAMGEVACVASAELPELVLGPVGDAGQDGGCIAIGATVELVELGAERSHRAAVNRRGHTRPGSRPMTPWQKLQATRTLVDPFSQ